MFKFNPITGKFDLVNSVNTTSTMGVAVHGSNANFARPVGYAVVQWEGDVEPLNAIDHDVWLEYIP